MEAGLGRVEVGLDWDGWRLGWAGTGGGWAGLGRVEAGLGWDGWRLGWAGTGGGWTGTDRGWTREPIAKVLKLG